MKRLLSVICLAAAAVVAVAQQGYAFRKTDIRAAYLHLKGDHLATGPQTSLTGPFVWFNIDSNSSLKPSGWNFYNPLAPGWLDPSEQASFAARYANTPPAQTAVNKRSVRYWWSNVGDLSDDDFSKLDVALLQVTTPNLVLNPSDREKLRRFVDKGGVLWVDYSYGSMDQTGGGPVAHRLYVPGTPNSNVQWDAQSPLLRYPNTLTPSEIQVIATGPNYSVQPTNLTDMAFSDASLEGASAIAPLIYNSLDATGEFSILKTVAAAGNGPTVMFAKIGDGYIVLTSRGLSEAVNRVGGNLNREFYAADPGGQTARGSASSFYATAVTKFVINAVSLASQSTQSGAGPRRNFSSFIDTGSPLLQTWSAPYVTPAGASVFSAPITAPRPPVIYKGMTFSVADDRVFCYDGNPRSDADRDGNIDDGYPDFNLGTESDLIFATAPAGVHISSATCVEVPNAAPGVPTDQLLVTTEDGHLLVYPIFDPVTRRCPATDTLAPVANLNPGLGGSGATAPGEWPHAPTVHEGIAYVADTVNSAGSYIGRVWQANLRTLSLVRSNSASTNPFVFGGTGNAIQRINGSPSVGYIPVLDNSGGMDKVMYLPLKSQGAPSIANAGVMSIWMGAKGEHPTSVSETGGVVSVVTRAATQGGLPLYMSTAGDPLAVHVSIIRNDGTVYTAGQMATVFSSIAESQGTLSLTLAPMATWPPAPDVDKDNGIRVDYTIDWGAAFPASIASVERGRLQFPTPSTAFREVVDGIALSPNGTIYATTSTQNVAPASAGTNDFLGSLFALREEGRGLFRMVYRWDLYPRHTFTYAGGSQNMPPVLPDNDPIQGLVVPMPSGPPLNVGSFVGGDFTAMSFQGAPVVRDGNVFVTVSGRKVSAPASALLCFKDDSSAREIRLGRNIGSQTAIVQPDFARSPDPTSPNTYSVLTASGFRIEKEPGDVGSTIRIDNMMAIQRGQIVDSINTSQPIILRESGRADTIIDPATLGDKWNPLKWYTIFHGMTIQSSAFAAGNTVFVSGKSVVPSILNSDTGVPTIAYTGYMSALRTDFDPSVAQTTSQAHVPYDPNPANFVPVNIVADDSRPYMRQVISMDYIRTGAGWTNSENSLSNIYPNQLYVWPQVPQNTEERGRTSFEDFIIRLNQCTLRSSSSSTAASDSYGVVGGDNLVMAWNPENTFCFKRANYWIADEGRIALFDPSGNVVYDSSVQSSTGPSFGDTNGANLTKFDRPTRVYPLTDSGDVLVVDSNQNRVLRMNPAGTVGRNLKEFSLDTTFVPAGYRSGDSLSFANPRDAATYVSEVTAANNPFGVKKALEYWVHFLVADQGNNRLVEIVDRYEEDTNTGNILGRVSEGTLLWHSPPAISGKGYAYNSITRVQVGPGHFEVIAGIGGKSPSRIDAGEPQLSSTVIGDTNPSDVKSAGTGNGGVVIFDSNLPGGYRVFSQFNTPAVDHTRIWDFNAGTPNWSTNSAMDIGVRTHFMSNLQSVTASVVPPVSPGGNPQLAIMITDNTGVYETLTDAVNPTTLDTRWMMPNWAFRCIRRTGGVPNGENPMGFFPTYARRIDSDNVTIVNGYQGKTLYFTKGYTGEVLQVDGRIDPVSGLQPVTYQSQGFSVNTVNLGFNTRSIKVRFGPIEGSRGLVLPVFADRR